MIHRSVRSIRHCWRKTWFDIPSLENSSAISTKMFIHIHYCPTVLLQRAYMQKCIHMFTESFIQKCSWVVLSIVSLKWKQPKYLSPVEEIHILCDIFAVRWHLQWKNICNYTEQYVYSHTKNCYTEATRHKKIYILYDPVYIMFWKIKLCGSNRSNDDSDS